MWVILILIIIAIKLVLVNNVAALNMNMICLIRNVFDGVQLLYINTLILDTEVSSNDLEAPSNRYKKKKEIEKTNNYT
jgi:hypothetical protein